jgi:hypothetical protein
MTSPAVAKEDVVAGSGFLGGLVTIFLPLLNAVPSGVSQSTVHGAVTAGAALALSSVLGWLVHHGLVSNAEISTGEKALEPYLPMLAKAADQLPLTRIATEDAKTVVRQAEQRLTAMEDKVSVFLTGSTAAVKPAEADVEKAALNALTTLLGGHEIVTTTGVVAIPTPVTVASALGTPVEPTAPTAAAAVRPHAPENL